MYEYQKQDCDLTLQEGLDCYYRNFPETTEIIDIKPFKYKEPNKVQKENKAKLQKVDINLKKKNIKNKNSKKAEYILDEDKIISQSDIKVNSNVDSKINKMPAKEYFFT